MKIIKYLLFPVLMVSAVLVGSATYTYLSAPKNELVVCNTPQEPRYIDEQELWTLIGNYKQKNSLQIPIKDESLCTIAKMRLGVIARDFNHDGFLKYHWMEQMADYTNISENLAMYVTDANQTLNAWIASPKHNEILLKNHPRNCVQCANINRVNYCVYISAI